MGGVCATDVPCRPREHDMTRAVALTSAVVVCALLTPRASLSQHGHIQLTLAADQVRYHLDGFGGNYCFGLDAPATLYTLDNLHIAWARTEMRLADWEPDNDNASPTDPDLDYYDDRDVSGSKLRREFLIGKRLQDMGIPFVASVWWLPEWLYAEPGKPRNTHRRRIDPDKWPELLECIGSYLLHAKSRYGVEPDLFSFNEPNIGVMVLLSAEEHRDAIKRIGAHLRSLGLKTKVLLADATGPRGTHTYALPTTRDPDAMQYVGAIGFHSWGGGEREHYAAWADLAQSLHLPLLVTELGVDPFAWKTGAFDTFDYALRELRMYQELLLYACPQATMQWQFTSDYAIVKEEKLADGRIQLLPTTRFHFIKHFCNLTPRGAAALPTTASHPDVLLTAFAAAQEGCRRYTLHIANFGERQEATISGIPADAAKFRAIQTGQYEGFRELQAVRAHERTIHLQLAARSLLTLTTMPAEGDQAR
jgi:hypothetical protein